MQVAALPFARVCWGGLCVVVGAFPLPFLLSKTVPFLAAPQAAVVAEDVLLLGEGPRHRDAVALGGLEAGPDEQRTGGAGEKTRDPP